jgi:hypothetical protein
MAVMDYNDPIGRVVINTINFTSGMTYLLHYDLRDNSQLDQVSRSNQGAATITTER